MCFLICQFVFRRPFSYLREPSDKPLSHRVLKHHNIITAVTAAMSYCSTGWYRLITSGVCNWQGHWTVTFWCGELARSLKRDLLVWRPGKVTEVWPFGVENWWGHWSVTLWCDIYDVTPCVLSTGWCSLSITYLLFSWDMCMLHWVLGTSRLPVGLLYSV